MEKRGQITVFIIVGIVLLFLSAGIFYITKNTVKETITTEGVPVAQKVPLTFSPIQKYTENCLRSVGKRGLIILGQQGGYINPDVLGKYSTVKPTDSAGINLQPTKVPYWFYSSPQNREDKIVFSTLQPKLYAKDDSSLSIETQMNRYVKEKLDDCLQNYTVFDNQGFKVKYGSKQVLTRVGTSSVNFQLTMMVTATKGESTTKMKIFYVNLPLKLKQYYELATHITQAQKNYSFLENHAMNIVSSFSGVDMQKLPPTVATGFSSVPTFFWTETKVKKDLQRLFTSYIPLLRFLGSNNFYGHIYPDGTLSNFYQGVYDQSVLTLKGAKGVNVNFNYFHWPVYLKTNSKKGVIKPFHFFVKYGVFKMGQQHYETNYDISFPVLVSLKDPAAFGGEGYDFVFALEGNVRNNKKPEPGKFVSAIPKPLPRLACDKNHWDTGILKTVVVDSFTKEPIEKVQIGFSIPDQDDCQIGFTNKQGNLESNYPAIYGGEVTYFKDDYLMNFYPIDTYQYRGNKSALIGYPVAGLSQDMPNKVVELHRVKAINVTVKKRNLKKCMQPLNCKYTLDPFSITTLLLPIPYKDISCEKGKEVCFFDKGLFAEDKPIFNMEVNGSISKYNNYYFTPGVEALDKKEEATIFLDRMFGKNRKVESEVFSVSDNFRGSQKKEVRLVPGIYKVTGSMVLKELVSFPAETRCTSYDILTWAEQTCENFNQTNMSKYVNGMLEWDTPATYLRITPEQLYGSDELIIYLPAQDIKGIPQKLNWTSEKCQGFLCLTGAGCAFDSCKSEPLQINGKVIEDIQIIGEMNNISRMPKIRKALEPRFI